MAEEGGRSKACAIDDDQAQPLRLRGRPSTGWALAFALLGPGDCYYAPMSDDLLDRLRQSYEERVRVLNAAMQERERELLVLSQVAARVHREEGVQAIFDIALEEILTRMDLHAAWIFVGDGRAKQLRLVASRGVSEAYLEDVRRRGLSECLCREVFWTGHHMQARNTTHCPRMPDIVAGLDAPVAHACIPLKFDGETRGVLNVAARPGQQFSEDELRFLDTLGHQIGLAVERARHREAQAAAQARLIQSERMAVLGTFASGLAHEVRNPLNSIALQLSILERRIGRCEPALAAEMNDLAAIIRQEIQRLEALVVDFLLFSRGGRVPTAVVDLPAIVEEVLRLMRPEADVVRVGLGFRPPAAPLHVPIDPESLKQVVINLVRNAVEAVGEGGQVSVECHSRDGQVHLQVRDTGPGLPAGLDPFEPFVTTKPKGTGLGLAIVQQIVSHHGGAVAAANAADGGAVFTVTLPLAPDAKDAHP